MILEKREKAHNILVNLINEKLYSKLELSKILKMSYPTFVSRYENIKWRAKEIDLIFEKLD